MRWNSADTPLQFKAALTLTDAIEDITGVPAQVLRKRGRVAGYSVAQRMSWVGNRTTTREEDMAYCLLGLFRINMPLLYGEGKTAFRRLQHEILRKELGESLFAWRPSTRHPILLENQLFASSPAQFAGSADVVDVARLSGPIFSSRGHWIALEVPDSPQRDVYERADISRHDLIVRLACGRWSTDRQTHVFTPCVLHLTTMYGSQYLLRHRHPGYDDHSCFNEPDLAGMVKSKYLLRHHKSGGGAYFDEADIESPEVYAPTTRSGTQYILMHGRESEPRRWLSGAIDSGGIIISPPHGGRPSVGEVVVLNSPLDGDSKPSRDASHMFDLAA